VILKQARLTHSLTLKGEGRRHLAFLAGSDLLENQVWTGCVVASGLCSLSYTNFELEGYQEVSTLSAQC
jgi:hypothetical protein